MRHQQPAPPSPPQALQLTLAMPPDPDPAVDASHARKAKARSSDRQPSSNPSPSPLAPLDAARSRCRGGLMALFVTLAICQVAVACLLVWYVGYLATKNTAANISAQLRSSVLQNCLQTVSNEFSSDLAVAHQLKFMTQKRFPDIGSRLNITNETGWAADLAALGAIYPRIGHFAIANRHNLLVAIARPSSTTGVAVMSGSGLCAALVTEVGSYNTTTSPLNTFFTTPIHPPDYNPPFSINGEITNTDSPEAIAQWLGESVLQVNYTLSARPFWASAVAAAALNQTGGWTESWAAITPTPGQPAAKVLSFSAFSSALDPVTGLVDWLTLITISATDFYPFFASLPFGAHGRAYLVSTTGRVAATSDAALTAIMNETTAAVDMFTSTDLLLQQLLPVLVDINLIVNTPATAASATTLVQYRATVYEQSLRVDGADYHMQAQMLQNFPFFMVILTKNSDFDGNLQAAIVTTGWLSIVVCVVAVIVSILVTSCVTRPLMLVVNFMERAVGVIAMPRSKEQRAMLDQLCTDWSADTHTTNAVHTSATVTSLLDEHESVAQAEANRTAACHALSCFNVGRSLREVDLMHRSFGSMLFALASYDELAAINQAKRAFIRYVFHEVRVPFNAIVLGIEQAQLELKTHLRASPACAQLAPCLDTMTIVREQGEVVSRILNDVLSMQKIEDCALTLDISLFDIAKMVRIALHAFRVPCAEKRLQVDIKAVASLDEFIEQERATIPLLQGRPSIRLGTSHAVEDGSVWRAHVEADPYRLRQALANLVSNAIKFSRVAGTIAVSLEFSEFAPAVAVPALAPVPVPLPLLKSSVADVLSAPIDMAAIQLSLPATAVAVAVPAAAASTRDDERRKDGLDGECSAADLAEADAEFNGRYLGSVALTIRVKDNGIGLSAENAAQVFQQYSQVAANKNQAGGGTGLGLSISKSIVELHGGRIGVSSVEGEGSEFWFTIPNTRVVLVQCDHAHTSLLGDVDSDSSSRGSISSRGGGERMDHVELQRAMIASAAVSGSDTLNPALVLPVAPYSHTPDFETVPVRFHPPPDLPPSLSFESGADHPFASTSSPSGNTPADFESPAQHSLWCDAAPHLSSHATPASGTRPIPRTSSSSSSSSSSRSNPIRAGARILVVEDSLPNRKLLISILQHMKLVASGVEDGQQCVDLFPVDAATGEVDQPFDCILMDGNMPVMNGVDACRILRARGVTIPILALTGNALAEDIRQFTEAGSTAVLTKPINRAQLHQALVSYLTPGYTPDDTTRRLQLT